MTVKLHLTVHIEHCCTYE